MLNFVPINSDGLFVSVTLLLAMVALVVVSIMHVGWVLDMKLGYIMFGLYVVFLAISLLLEFCVVEL